VHSLAVGLKYVDLYNVNTPADVLRWLKKYHNEFHGGSATSFLEVFDDAERAQASWAIYKRDNMISASSGKERALLRVGFVQMGRGFFPGFHWKGH
jgi:hypothetical protein